MLLRTNGTVCTYASWETFNKAWRNFREAQRLEPLSPMINVQLGVGFYLARSYDEAARILLHTIELEPAFWPGHYFLGTVYAQQRDDSRAQAEIEISAELSARHPLTLSGLGRIHGRVGRTDQARALIEEFGQRSITEYVSPYHSAVVYLGLGDENLALERLQECVAERCSICCVVGG